MNLEQLKPRTKAAIQKLIECIHGAESSGNFGTYGIEISFQNGQIVRLREITEQTFPVVSSTAISRQGR